MKFLARQWGSLPPLGAFLNARRLVAAPGRRAALAGLLLGALLAGCGFQPRGQVFTGAAAGSLFLDAPPALLVDLESTLSGTMVSRSPSREGADAVLVVASERFERRVLSVDPFDGSEREAEIAYVVEFRIGPGSDPAAMDQQQITLVREFLYTPEEIVAKEHEEDLMRAELRREAAARILRRAAAAMSGAMSQ